MRTATTLGTNVLSLFPQGPPVRSIYRNISRSFEGSTFLSVKGRTNQHQGPNFFEQHLDERRRNHAAAMGPVSGSDKIAAETMHTCTHAAADEVPLTGMPLSADICSEKHGNGFFSTVKGCRYALSLFIPVSLLLGIWGATNGPSAIANHLNAVSSTSLQVRRLCQI